MNPHRAMMIVDVQRGFAPPSQFVERLRHYSLRFPCRVFTQFLNSPESMFRKMLKQKSSLPGSADAELLLVPQATDLGFQKHTYGLTAAHIRKPTEFRLTINGQCPKRHFGPDLEG